MDEKWIVGIDLGGTTTKMAFIDLDGAILHKWEIPTDISNNGSKIVHDIGATLQAKLVELNQAKENMLGIGIGAPGAVDFATGSIMNAVNIGWKVYPLKDLLGQITDLLVVVDNDANVAAFGEMWKGSGAGSSDMVAVTLGTGVGGGIISNGLVVHGINGAAGEIGHMTILPEGGAPCNCGKHGCLETIASATGIARLGREEALREPNSGLAKTIAQTGSLTAKDVIDLAKAGDQAANSVVDRVAFYLGLAMSHLGNTVNPEKIIVGGGVSKAGDFLLEPVRDYFRKFSFPSVANSTTITVASLGNDAGVIGAAGLVKQTIESSFS